jgi:DNA polymerase-3 subunit delta'
LEDPPSNFYFCLVTSHPEQVLPTIVSRCQGFRFAPLKKDEIIQGLKNLYGVSDQQAQFATAQADGSLVKAIEILHTGDIARTIAIDEFIMKQVIMRKLEELYKQVRNSKDLDKRQMKDILLNIDHWLRDIMLMNVGLEPVYNADLLDRLIKFQNNIKYDNLLELRKILLLMIDLIEKNVYIELIYLNLIHKFQKNMSLKK